MERVGEQSGGTPSIWQSLLEIPSRDEYDGWRLRVFRALPLKATEDGASFKAENIARLQTRDFSTEVGAVGDGLAVGLLEGAGKQRIHGRTWIARIAAMGSGEVDDRFRNAIKALNLDRIVCCYSRIVTLRPGRRSG